MTLFPYTTLFRSRSNIYSKKRILHWKVQENNWNPHIQVNESNPIASIARNLERIVISYPMCQIKRREYCIRVMLSVHSFPYWRFDKTTQLFKIIKDYALLISNTPPIVHMHFALMLFLNYHETPLLWINKTKINFAYLPVVLCFHFLCDIFSS